MKQINTLYRKMAEYFKEDPCRIQHFVKVHSFAKLIGEEEARALTDDNLPDRLYAEYVAIINDNRNANK